MNTAMKEIQDKIFNHQLRGSEKDTPKPLLHPKHDHINKVRSSSSPETLVATHTMGSFVRYPVFRWYAMLVVSLVQAADEFRRRAVVGEAPGAWLFAGAWLLIQCDSADGHCDIAQDAEPRLPAAQ